MLDLNMQQHSFEHAVATFYLLMIAGGFAFCYRQVFVTILADNPRNTRIGFIDAPTIG
jgi:hypothetical protein